LSGNWKRKGNMKQSKQDRRSQRSRQLVNSAMMQLLLEKRYEEISVQDIVEQAGVGRSTFYTHYFDKEDVQASLMEEILETLNRQLSQRKTGQGIVPGLELFRHIQDHHQHFEALWRGPVGEKLWEAAQNTLSALIEQNLTNTVYSQSGSPALPVPVVANYLAGAFLNLLKWWVRAGMPYPPEEMEQMFEQLALDGLGASFKGEHGISKPTPKEA
jgi:AcrR family transcriptional regulator